MLDTQRRNHLPHVLRDGASCVKSSPYRFRPVPMLGTCVESVNESKPIRCQSMISIYLPRSQGHSSAGLLVSQDRPGLTNWMRAL